MSREMNRRSALKILGALPLAAALPDIASAESTMTPPSSDAAAALAPTASKFFTAHEMATVRVLADLVIPRDERSGSATEAKVPEFMDYMLSHDASERTQVEMRGGLAWMDVESRKRFGTEFIHASHAQQTAILDDIAWPKKTPPQLSQGAAFFSRFRDYVASGFFSSQMGHEDVHYIGNVFNPNWQGCGDEAMHKLGVSFDIMKGHK